MGEGGSQLEALAEQGKKSAVTVIRAGENLSLMLAGAQLGITICSILLGRVAEPAVAHLLEEPFGLLGIPDALLHTVSFIVALSIVLGAALPIFLEKINAGASNAATTIQVVMDVSGVLITCAVCGYLLDGTSPLSVLLPGVAG